MQGGQWKIFCRVKWTVASGVIVDHQLGYMSDFSDSSFSFGNTCRHYSQYQTTFPWLFCIQYFYIVCACIYACLCLIWIYILTRNI